MPAWVLPAISVGASLLGGKKASDAAGQQRQAMGAQQRIIDEILLTARNRQNELAPLRSAAQSRFMELLNQGTPAFDPSAFRDQQNPFRANFGNATPVAARAALAPPSAPAGPSPAQAQMDKVHAALAGIERLKMPDKFKATISDKIRAQATSAGWLPG